MRPSLNLNLNPNPDHLN